MSKPINHCGLVDQIKEAQMDEVAFGEAVQARTAEIVEDAQNPDVGAHRPKHKLAGIEIVAVAIATEVIREGARQVALDMDLRLDNMIQRAQSAQISNC